MVLGDAASWATIIATVIAAVTLLVSVRSVVNKRQRELRGRLREVCRDVSQACRDYEISDWRRGASHRLAEASDKLKVIHDERILSPTGQQIEELQMWVYDLSTRQDAVQQLSNSLWAVMSKEERDRSIALYGKNTEHVRVYVSKLAATYRKATSKMDNGNIFVYWRFRVLPPFVRRNTELASPRRRVPTAEVEE